MSTTYRQQSVTVVRVAKEDDPDWDSTCTEEQFLITNGDGSQTVAPKGQIVGIEGPQASLQMHPSKPETPKAAPPPPVQVQPSKADAHPSKTHKSNKY